MKSFAVLLLTLVNLISSGLVEFAINTCCETESVSCCVQDECCCTESESHFYYFTAKYQNSERQIKFKNLETFGFYTLPKEETTKLVLPYTSKNNEYILAEKIRKKAPPSLFLKYEVWII